MKMISISKLGLPATLAAAVLFSAAFPNTASASVASFCMNTGNGSGGSQEYYPYLFNNNTFGWSNDKSGSSECYTLNYVNSPNNGIYYDGWGSSWNWDYQSGNVQYDVKAYPSQVYGWQYGYSYSGLGLPARIWNNPDVPVYMSFSLYGTQHEDVLIDNWILSSPTATSGQSDEIEIFVSNNISACCSGNNLGNQTVDNVYYYINSRYPYENGGSNSWYIYTFVPNQGSTNFSESLNVDDFVNSIVYDYGDISNSLYLAGTQVGVEVYEGNGGVTFNPSSISAN